MWCRFRIWWGWFAVLVGVWAPPSQAEEFEDSDLRVEVPAGWSFEGQEGEYWLTSAEDEVASLLVLAPAADRPLEVRLAEIDEQFISTGILDPVTFSTRSVDHQEVVYREYRLTGPHSEGPSVRLHQYIFARADALVLLQVESVNETPESERLFVSVFESLELRATPDPFLVEDPFRARED